MSHEILFTVKKNDQVGRYGVASCPLKPGTVILVEEPFAYGPKSDSPPLCLGCLSPTDCTNLCSICSWPVCNPKCESHPAHQDNECKIFVNAGVKFQLGEDPFELCLQYECITPLRVLLAKEKNPKYFSEDVEHMETHSDIRRNKPIWNFNQINIVNYLRGPCKLEIFSEELIHMVCGILEINAFEARTPSGYPIRCLYPKLAMLSHDCVSNTQHSISPQDFTVSLRTSVSVAEGEELFCNYTYSSWPTLVRRMYLQESKYFDCQCNRCRDKTELGSHLGTLKCQKCDNGIILSTNPLSFECEWHCTHCAFKTRATSVKKIYDTIQGEIDIVEMISGARGIELREGLYRKYRSVLHPKNSYMSILRTALTQLYGRAEGYTNLDLPDILLERKVEICYQLLEVVDVVEPGFTRIRGITLYELHVPLMMLARNEFSNEMIDAAEFRKKMEKSVDILRESVEILALESPSSDEGKLGLLAKQSLQSLEQNFELLIQTA